MFKLDLINMAYKNLWRRKVRTFLTVLGVLIGTTSIVVMISIGIGLNDFQRKTLEQWGSLNQIEVYTGMMWDAEGNPIGDANPLNDAAVEELKSIPGVVAVSPGYNLGGRAIWGKKEGYLQLVGLDEKEMSNFEFEIGQGRLLEEGDRFNIVVGSEVGMNFRDRREMEMMDRMYRQGRMIRMEPQENKTSEMLNQRVTLEINNYNGQTKRYNFMVVGILSEKNRDKSWQAFAPIEEIKRIRDFTMGGGRNTETKPPSGKKSSGPSPDDYEFIWVRTADVNATKTIANELRERGYQAYSMADALEGIEQTSKTMQAILGGIGGITLLVAALGIINTMIMSIYERTREIGIMKVIGASFLDIRMLFLTEAGLLGFLGGLFGLIFSYSISKLINHLSADFINQGMAAGDVAYSISLIPPWLALFALGFSVLIGVIAGVYPANRAVKLSPIKAIRNE